MTKVFGGQRRERGREKNHQAMGERPIWQALQLHRENINGGCISLYSLSITWEI